MKLKEVIEALEKFAPLPLQESYDNAGLQCGLTETEVSGALLCLDVTEQVIDEAINLGFNLIVSHHPLLFRGLKQISDQTIVERCIRKAIVNQIAIYSAHTNLDNVEGGVNYVIANKIGLTKVDFLETQGNNSGSGLIGTLETPIPANTFLANLKKQFNIECLMHNQILDRNIKTVALCGGAGDFLLDKAIQQKADAFITGEMHYHLYFGHEQQIQIAVMGHYQSEQFTIQLLQEILQKTFPNIKCKPTGINTNPIKYL